MIKSHRMFPLLKDDKNLRLDIFDFTHLVRPIGPIDTFDVKKLNYFSYVGRGLFLHLFFSMTAVVD